MEINKKLWKNRIKSIGLIVGALGVYGSVGLCSASLSNYNDNYYYQEGFDAGIERSRELASDEKVVLYHAGYSYMKDMDGDGKVDLVREVSCGSDVILFENGFGPSQSVGYSTEMQMVNDNVLSRYDLGGDKRIVMQH